MTGNKLSSQSNPAVHIKTWVLISLANLLVAISIGALLRYAFVKEVSWLEFKNFLHAHSHVAMMGWVYLVLFSFFIKSFLTPKQQSHKSYKVLFWATQLTVLGMLVSFPIYGYGFMSILFSSVHVILSYVFAIKFLSDLKLNFPVTRNSIKFVKTALFFLIFSTLALWGMAPILLLSDRSSGLYHMAVQFYLHFQFNGWFLFGILGLFFHMLENQNIEISRNVVIAFFSFLIISTFLSYALAVTWSNPKDFIFWINSVGVILQFLALIYFIKILKQVKIVWAAKFNYWTNLLFLVSALSFLIKVAVQTVIVIPYFATVAYTVRNFVIGFIHLMLIGVVTHFLLGYGSYTKTIKMESQLSKWGLVFFTSSFLLSEALLFIQGLMLWHAKGFLPLYYEILFIVSAVMPLGLGMILISQTGLKWSNSFHSD